jgi:hypothetical protein
MLTLQIVISHERMRITIAHSHCNDASTKHPIFIECSMGNDMSLPVPLLMPTAQVFCQTLSTPMETQTLGATSADIQCLFVAPTCIYTYISMHCPYKNSFAAFPRHVRVHSRCEHVNVGAAFLQSGLTTLQVV